MLGRLREVNFMPHIRPVSDLRNSFAEISKIVHETAEPVFLTKNGYGDMVVMSIEAYERKLFESQIYFKLKEAEIEAKDTNLRHTHEEIFSDLRASLANKVGEGNA
jgi:prevent-host-death family protein